MPTYNLLHNVWCDVAAGSDNALLTIQSVTTDGNPVFGLYSMKVSVSITQTLIGEFPFDLKNNVFASSDTEFQITPDQTQVWGNLATSNYESGNLHIMEVATGELHSFSYPSRSGYRYATVPQERNATQFLTVLNNGATDKWQGSFDGDQVKLTSK